MTSSAEGREPAGSAAPVPPVPPVPRVLCDTRALTSPAPEAAGAVWKLAESGRQLDANVVHLPAGQRVAPHTEPDLDVLLHVLAGGGAVETAEGRLPLAPGTLLWLPHGAARGLVAGEAGLSYLTVHRRRPGMVIGRRP
ncbi:cupin domain-containing protein [Streptantibioticus cattleyicolor]|uniref:AraC-type arabinose-binding/dimerisation domain-containing protein n=1 Tax=Streptantibioticus cattleyicolor (strain ATCC 35852 / DSM 46488 / JCM 4925 / NBRC 14057 / NRRL 8057) TaxID=1003195 RepID=F8JJ07_STREN|nr:hypothetical protein [Streptantibioticus cattleyicolor]AEW98900.1 hypothetical protein SCATT_p07070 [Streptantibioticus cattleyicolor NRRL 8057 = DSM 46488]CCB72053.1 conserved protein of unknown function [Streptantibioticus cattleyicolor NRRL 8057 = DSM 46488]